MIEFRPVADGVHVARTQPLDVNTTLVLGDSSALLVDTLSTEAQAGELLAAVRAITPLPLTVLVTHFHFDHCLGAAVLAAGGRPVWAHPAAAAQLAEHGPHWQRRWHDEWAATEPELAAGVAAARIQVPDRLVPGTATLDLGGREVTVCHPGPGHTDGDLTVRVPDVDVVLAGDLVEQGAPPDFTDAHPLDWPEALAVLLRTATGSTVFVPGHGAPVGTDFVAAQHAELSRLDWLIRDGHADKALVEAVAERGPYPLATCVVAVARGFAALDGRD